MLRMVGRLEFKPGEQSPTFRSHFPSRHVAFGRHETLSVKNGAHLVVATVPCTASVQSTGLLLWIHSALIDISFNGGHISVGNKITSIHIQSLQDYS